MTYEESQALMTDMVFRGKVKVAALKYADSLLGEPTATPGHNANVRWAQTCFQNPDMTAGQLQSPTVMDAAVQEAGKDVTDAALQGSVEAVVKKML